MSDKSIASSRKLKRSRAAEEGSDRSNKQQKLENEIDTIRNHLPEVQDAAVYAERDLAGSREDILEHAKSENTIGILPRPNTIETVYYDYLKWSISDYNKNKASTSKKKVAVLIVEKDTSVEAHARYIRSKPVLDGASCSTNISAKPRKDTLQSDVLITTSTKLLEALSGGVLKLKHFHSIVFEDVQPIRNQDCHSFLPVVQVMNNFYFTSSSSSKPRVFAVALSSHPSPSQFDSKMLQLELTLDCRVFGVSEERRQEIIHLPNNPNETIVLYDSVAQKVSQTPLYQKLLKLDPSKKHWRRFFRAADTVVSKLGNCASDLVWRLALKEIEAKIPTWQEDDDPDSTHGIQIRMRDTVRNWTFTMPNLNPSAPGFNVAHKFLRLVQVLETCENYGENFRALIFVQHRSTAYALAEMLRMVNDKISFTRPIWVSGSLDFYEQQSLLSNFAAGIYNVLVATKSVEDIGIPNASMVIRFDLFDDQMSHAHARSCARGRESHLIHLVERNNDHHRQVLDRSSSDSAAILQWMDAFHRSPRVPPPPQKLKSSSRTYLSDDEDETDEENRESYLVHPTTSGRIYPQEATMVLISLVSHLREELPFPEGQSLFDFQLVKGKKTQGSQFTCSINLPGTNVDGITGSAVQSIYLARRSASFEACKRLLAMGVLDHRMVPLPSSLVPHVHGLENLEGAKVAGTRRYPVKQPDFWSKGNSGPVSILYPTVLAIESHQTQYSPIVLLTRQPLPPLMEFNLFASGNRVVVRSFRGAPFEVDDDQMKKIRGFSMRVFRSFLNKPLNCALENMTYFLAPLVSWQTKDAHGLTLPQLESSLDWALMGQATDSWIVPIRHGSAEEIEEDLADAVIQDRWIEFTRRYHVVKVRADMSPLSKPEPTEREASHESFLAYVEANRQNFSGLENEDQPLVEVEKVLPLLSNLSPRVKDIIPPSKAAARFLIPELCGKFVLPSSLLRTSLLLPSILWKMEHLLIVKEMNNRFFDNALREDLLSKAITSVSAGMDYDYERLELLGDSFLKYLSSIFVFVTNPTQNEGSLHISRQKVISNRALLQAAIRIDIPPYVRSTLFNTKSWVPPNFITLALTGKDKTKGSGAGGKGEGEGPAAGGDDDASPSNMSPEITKGNKSTLPSLERARSASEGVPSELDSAASSKKKKSKRAKKTNEDEGPTQPLGDKALADVVEAITGAAYISGGRECALRVLKIMTVPIPGISQWSDFGSRVVIPYANTVAHLRAESIATVEKIIGHKFREPHLLAQAMTHSSVRTNGMTSYERLEFIGDAILDFMVIRHIYDRDRALSPGGLTLLKSAMVSNDTLAAICVSCGLHEHLLFESHQLFNQIQQYASQIKQKAVEEYRDAEENQRPPGQYWVGVEPPKTLSDLVESIIGAVYISDNFSPVGAEAFFDNVLRPFFDKHITLQTLTHHPTKTLFELIQAHGCQMMKITKDPRRDGVTTCHVLIHDETLSTASGPTPTSAARKASIMALEAIKEDASLLSKCDCRGRVKDKNSWMAQGFSRALSSLIEEHSDGTGGDGIQTEMRVAAD